MQSLVAIALSVMAVDGTDKAQSGSASGVFNMVGNVGGAIGIVIASQIMVERTTPERGEGTDCLAPCPDYALYEVLYDVW